MECCKASNDAGARIWQAADVGYLALQYGAWLTWACLTLQLSSHLVPLLLQESSHLVPLLLQESSHLVPLLSQESSLHFLSFLLKLFWFTLHVEMTSIQNGGYFWLKTNYRVYPCCLQFLSAINYPSFFLGGKRFRGVH